MPTIVLQGLRLLICIQAYMYHSSLGMFHLSWVLASFLIHERAIFFFSCVVMLPLYGWEFLIQYGMRTPALGEIDFFKSKGVYFVEDMKYPVAEQGITYLILALLFMCIGCLKMTFQHDQDE